MYSTLEISERNSKSRLIRAPSPTDTCSLLPQGTHGLGLLLIILQRYQTTFTKIDIQAHVKHAL